MAKKQNGNRANRHSKGNAPQALTIPGDQAKPPKAVEGPSRERHGFGANADKTRADGSAGNGEKDRAAKERIEAVAARATPARGRASTAPATTARATTARATTARAAKARTAKARTAKARRSSVRSAAALRRSEAMMTVGPLAHESRKGEGYWNKDWYQDRSEEERQEIDKAMKYRDWLKHVNRGPAPDWIKRLKSNTGECEE